MTLFYAATGRTPFSGKSYLESVADIISGKVFLPDELEGLGLSRDMKRLIARCLEVDYRTRPTPLRLLSEFKDSFSKWLDYRIVDHRGQSQETA